jgi:hypothetical protein
MQAIDRVFGVLLGIGAILHGIGTWAAFHTQPVSLLWAWSASFAVLLLAAINLLRTMRPGDAALAWICFAGCLTWMGFSLWLGALVHNFLDFRPLIHIILAAVLAVFSLRAAVRTPPGPDNSQDTRWVCNPPPRSCFW